MIQECSRTSLLSPTYICHFPFTSSLFSSLPVICLVKLYEGVLFVPQLPQVYLSYLPLPEMLPVVTCPLTLCQHPSWASAKAAPTIRHTKTKGVLTLLLQISDIVRESHFSILFDSSLLGTQAGYLILLLHPTPHDNYFP